VLYDSEGTAPSQIGARFGVPHLVGGALVRDGTVTISGQDLAAAAVTVRRGEVLVAARSTDATAGAAALTLVPRLLIAGLAALVVAILLAALLARTLSVPLQELARAAGDVAAGSYGRRVTARGPGEIALVADAFNRMAAAVERSRAQQRDFLANVSHELKTPLTSLIGFSQALVDGSLRTEDERRRAATVVHEESQRLLRMSQELLDLARMEAGQMPLRREAVDLAALLRQESEIVRQRLGERALGLRLELPPSLGPASGDVERLRQVVDNLLDNAVKYAVEGTEIVVRAGARMGSVEATFWNAAGAAAPDPQRMFERFYRGDPSRSAAGGVGLGLAISRELILAMGGSLDADVRDGGVLLRLRLSAYPQDTS
jgi:signal transduction histidine kinase